MIRSKDFVTLNEPREEETGGINTVLGTHGIESSQVISVETLWSAEHIQLGYRVWYRTGSPDLLEFTIAEQRVAFLRKRIQENSPQAPSWQQRTGAAERFAAFGDHARQASAFISGYIRALDDERLITAEQSKVLREELLQTV